MITQEKHERLMEQMRIEGFVIGAMCGAMFGMIVVLSLYEAGLLP